ncbi:tetratricopeptide repeat protein 31 isoform X5 [Pezoporus flaviventris]|uniref:tetratricopeptide repeat protein 31 isoform X5 n=1 Tax=Pezoporus flaviventris TaxID=889875 RepID=UPI002AAFB90C|nr:tetratricopeptide repeat protein 31 isoform X5 [Pezoporus flaviventris]
MLGHGRGRWEERGLGRARANPEERAGLTRREVSAAEPRAGPLRSSGTRPGTRLEGRRGRGAAQYGPRGPPSCQHPAWRRGSPGRRRAPLPVRPVRPFLSSASGVGRCGKRAGSGARGWAPPGAGLPPPPAPGAARSAPAAGAAPRSAPSTARPSAGRCPRTSAPWATGPGPGTRSAAEAERNAQELVAEEERVKRKAEKKKLKKKKQKERKKREKLGQESQAKQKAESTPPSPSSAAGARHPQGGDAEEEEGAWLDPSPGDSAATPGEEGGDGEARPEEMELDLGLCPPRPCPQEELDLSCTFVFKARQKAGVRLPAPGREKPPRTDPERGRIAPGKAPAPLDTSAMQQSLVLAGQGNAAALRGRYPEAVRAFTAALQLNPREHRLLGNRSYCYEKLQRYEEALGDAERALGLQPRWAKGLFRKGKALRGLQGPVQVVVAQAQHLSVSQRYAEAAQTFEELLRLHRTGTGTGTDTDAAAQLEACRALLRQQSSLGGVPTSPPSPMSPLSPLEAAEPALPLRSGSSHHKAMGMSGFITIGSSRIQAQCQPPRGCFPLWVGNVTPRISRSVLQHCFGQFGEIQSIRMLPERRCAFLNYTCKEAAEAAFEAMRDSPVEGTLLALQLKHPSHATPRPRWYPQPCLGEPL